MGIGGFRCHTLAGLAVVFYFNFGLKILELKECNSQ